VTFDPTAYGPSVATILGDGQRLMPLGPGTPDESKRSLLANFDPLRDLPIVKNANAAKACHAGLWLYWDFLDESHSISQDLHTPEGSAWHAIMHRREGDFSNSKYWYRRVGAHPIFEGMKRASEKIGYAYSNPFDFVDYCEKVLGKGNDDERLAEAVQMIEWKLLFEHCHRG
jgi:hypothetical protein